MSNTIRAVLSALLLTGVSTAQCNGIHPPGVIGIVGIPAPGCNEINPSQPVPFLSIDAAPSASAGGPLSFVWSRTPNYATAPGTYEGFVAIDLTQPPPYVIPGFTHPNCFMTVGPTVILWQIPVVVNSSCYFTQFAVLPPLPGLAGVIFYSQGILWDLTQGNFAVTKPFAFQYQS